ncbi:LPP20 family lipoprotein [Thalassomonas actiniarum]|uniref:LPP20 family lipoprotein n=1 Tax=Thalassomonas actiniarum TaxID=485447 RepID=A0AAE9YXP8_9GAMM|nr:LPP20 family lipoprotein [Thalassomonas actiniarum]WDE02482.1 LPP20 family lipoprotein [Thalassomonas actiniarum]
MKPIFLVMLLATVFSASSHSSEKIEVNQPASTKSHIPQWVFNPVIKDGIAASNCVKFSGNISIDQKKATANARTFLAQQVQTWAEALDKTYDSRSDSNDSTTSNATFTSISRQLTSETLNGIRAVKFDIATINNVDYYCTLVALSPDAVEVLFKHIVDKSRLKSDPTEQSFPYQEFKAHTTKEEREAEIKHSIN